MTTTIEVIARNTGEIAYVVRSEAEKVAFQSMPPITGIQSPLVVDLTANPGLMELIDGNSWHRYRIVAGRLQKDGAEVFIHPDTEAESDRRALPDIIQEFRDAALAPTPTILTDYLANAAPNAAQSRDALKALVEFHELSRSDAFSLTRKLGRVVRFLAKTTKVLGL